MGPGHYVTSIVLAVRMSFIFLLSRESDRYLPRCISHIFMAYSTGSQPFAHLLSLKAFPNHFRHPVIRQIRGMIGLVLSLSAPKKILEDP